MSRARSRGRESHGGGAGLGSNEPGWGQQEPAQQGLNFGLRSGCDRSQRNDPKRGLGGKGGNCLRHPSAFHPENFCIKKNKGLGLHRGEGVRSGVDVRAWVWVMV